MARRARGDGSVFQRADGRWVAVLDLGGGQEHRKRKFLYAKTRPAVLRRLQKAKAEHAKAELILSAPTVEQWMRHWRDEITEVRPSTMKGYNTYIEQHIIPRIGPHRLDRLEPVHVRRLYADMRKPCPAPDLTGKCPHTPSHGRAEASIRQCHAVLSRALKVAEREGKVARNVAALVDPPGTERNPRQPLTLAEARGVLAKADEGAMASRWYAALWLGLRQGEALGLTWADVDLDNGLIYISRALQRVKGRGLVFVQPKSRASSRPIPVPPMVLARLKVHWAREAAKGATGEWLVWGGVKPTDPAKDYKAWGRLLADADAPRYALHAARNTAGSLLHAAGVPEKTIAEILGHGSVSIAQDHYITSEIETRRVAMLQLERYASG